MNRAKILKFGKKYGPCFGETDVLYQPAMQACQDHGLTLEVIRHEKTAADTRRTLLKITTDVNIITQEEPLYVRISFSHRLKDDDKPEEEGTAGHASIGTLSGMARLTERVFEISDDDADEDISYFWFTYNTDTQLDFCFAEVQCWKGKNAFLPPDTSKWSTDNDEGDFFFTPNTWNQFGVSGFHHEAEVNIYRPVIILRPTTSSLFPFWRRGVSNPKVHWRDFILEKMILTCI